MVISINLRKFNRVGIEPPLTFKVALILFLASCIVAMVTYFATKFTATYSAIIIWLYNARSDWLIVTEL